MKRRDFSRAGAGVVLAGAAGWGVLAQAQTTGAAQMQGRKPQEGDDYLKLDQAVPVETPAGKIEVIEFFWYNCPHCNAFEPMLDAWIRRQPKDVAVRRVPVAFRDDFVPQQRLFYTLEAMGLVERLHAKVFYAIHVERQRLDRPESIADWVAKQGVDRARFMEQYNSFSVASKAGRATQLQKAYRVDGVPALGVAGRYYTDGALAHSMERALQIVDHLSGEVRRSR